MQRKKNLATSYPPSSYAFSAKNFLLSPVYLMLSPPLLLLWFVSLHPPLLYLRETDPTRSPLPLPSQASFEKLPLHHYCPPPENHKPPRSFRKLTAGLTLKPSKMKLAFTQQQ
jgi:hypothetical protein